MQIQRPQSLSVARVELPTPIFFPSISTVKTACTPLEYVGVLNALNVINGQYLVSAFDLAHADVGAQAELKRGLDAATEAGTIVLMDSGNYESYWKNSSSSWMQSDFHRVLKDFPVALAFGFDEQQPPSDFDEHVRLICDRYTADQTAAGQTIIIPIVHAKPEMLPTLCAAVANATGISMLAVAERRLGGGVIERTRTLESIRRALDETGHYVGLHLLGTGNPISIALYSIAGADSFDGLEWCQTVVDHETATLFHLTHADFFKLQTQWGDSDWPFHVRTLAHNLEFYSDWVRRLRKAIHDGNGIEFCRINFPQRIFSQCAAQLGWSSTT